MSDTSVIIDVVRSGSPVYLEQQSPPSWAPMLSANLASSLMDPFTVTVAPRREMVFLTRAHQRIMDRALRRSLRIIA